MNDETRCNGNIYALQDSDELTCEDDAASKARVLMEVWQPYIAINTKAEIMQLPYY